MYIAQHKHHKERYLISPDEKEEAWTTNPGLAYKWKSLGGCASWCGGCGDGLWTPVELNSINTTLK